MKKSKIICFVFVWLLLIPFSLGAAASGPPTPANAFHDQYAGDSDGAFTITWNMWWGNNAGTVRLYEKAAGGSFTVVSEQTLPDKTPSAQGGVFSLADKAEGLYEYYIELENSFGSSRSASLKVGVGMASGPTSKIILKDVDVDRTVLQVTIDQADSLFAIETEGEKNPLYKLVTNNEAVISVAMTGGKLSIKGLQAGRASVKIEETNSGHVRYLGVRVRNTDGSLPGMPEYVALGSMSEDSVPDLDCWKDFYSDNRNKRMDIRYIYLNEGPIKGWRTSLKDEGKRASRYIEESRKLGIIPFFVYYNIPEGSESYQIDLAHMQDAVYMKAYFEDLKFLLDLCKKYAEDDLVGIIFEPDFLGYMMQQSGTEPDQLMAQVAPIYDTVLGPDDPRFPNTLKGLVEAVNYMVNKYYPQAYNGWQFNLWSHPGPGIPGKGLMHSTDIMGQQEGEAFIRKIAAETADFYIKAGVLSYNADFISIDKYGLDGAYQPGAAANPADSTWFWNADQWNNYLIYCSVLHEKSRLPVIPWQIPVGHINSSQKANPYKGGLFPDLANTSGHYEDSAPSFFLGDTFKPGTAPRLDWFSRNSTGDPKVKVNGGSVTWESHIEEARDAGLVAIFFGAGVGAATDGVGTPAADDYWWLTACQEYFKSPVPLKNTQPSGPVITAVPEVKTGRNIVVYGRGFTADSQVFISGGGISEYMKVLSFGSTEIVCQGGYLAGSYQVKVVNGTEESTLKELKIIDDQVQAPEISSVPGVKTGEDIVIKGSYFEQDSQVFISGEGISEYMTVISAFSGELVCRNSYLKGTYSVKVINGTLESNTSVLTISGTSQTPDPWAAYTDYKIGDLVSHKGAVYSCRRAHSSLPGWEPSIVPALWLKQ